MEVLCKNVIEFVKHVNYFYMCIIICCFIIGPSFVLLSYLLLFCYDAIHFTEDAVNLYSFQDSLHCMYVHGMYL